MTHSQHERPAVALVSFDSLGDSLIYVMVAENLRVNGFEVTLFSNIAHQLKNWVPQLTTRELPPLAQFDSALTPFSLTLMSPPAVLRAQLTTEACRLAREKWVLICQKAPQEWYFDHTERLYGQLPKEHVLALRGLPSCAGSIRFREFATESVVDITLAYLREKMKLDAVVRNVPLSPPEGLLRGRHQKRIIVSPDSAGPEKKEWHPKGFLNLCQRLRQNGYDPHIVVAPRNHARWMELAAGEFEVPVFVDIGSLASFIYESAALIANDSGNGHLASFLGVPVITIYRKRNEHFHWRPAWGPAKVVCPVLRLPWPGEDALWRPFIGVKRILRALQSFQSLTCDTQ